MTAPQAVERAPWRKAATRVLGRPGTAVACWRVSPSKRRNETSTLPSEPNRVIPLTELVPSQKTAETSAPLDSRAEIVAASSSVRRERLITETSSTSAPVR